MEIRFKKEFEDRDEWVMLKHHCAGSVARGIEMLGKAGEAMEKGEIHHLTVTSISNGRHATRSKHALGKAFDIRTSDKDDREVVVMVFALIAAGFWVRVELDGDREKHYWQEEDQPVTFPEQRGANQHLHVEW